MHNQRIERLWLDVFKEVCDSVCNELYGLENEGLLDNDNIIHRFCVQHIYINVINRKLSLFQSGWNLHGLRTENNKTPRQLWLEGVLSNYNSELTAIREIRDVSETLNDRLSQSLQNLDAPSSISVLDNESVDNTSSFYASIELHERQKQQLHEIMNRDNISDKEKYQLCVASLN